MSDASKIIVPFQLFDQQARMLTKWQKYLLQPPVILTKMLAHSRASDAKSAAIGSRGS
jgi:hypothetical protein